MQGSERYVEHEHDARGAKTPRGNHQTLYQVLGVPEDASLDAIEAAYQRHLMAARAQRQNLPPGVEQARNVLRSEKHRLLYGELLAACRSGLPIEVPGQNFASFQQFCTSVRIQWWEDPVAPGTFHLRLQGQSPPDFVAAAASREKQQAKTDLRELERHELARFRWERPGQTFFLRFGYVFVFGLAAVLLIALAATWAFDGTLSRWLRLSGVLDSRETSKIEKENREALALATNAITQLEASRNSFHDAVKQGLNAAPGETGELPKDLAALLDKETSVRTAWKNIEDALRVSGEISKKQPLIDAASARIQGGQFLKADGTTLEEIRAWAVSAAAAIDKQKENVRHIQSLLEVERFSRAGESTEKGP